MHGGVPNKEFNENNNQCILDSDKELSYILNELAIDRSLLDNPDHIQYIMFLLGEGADRDTQNRHGKTLSHYLDKRLSDILGWLASDRGKLNDYIRSIISLLQAGADRDTQNRHGKTPLDYLNEELLNILNQLAIDSNLLDNSNNTQYIMLLLGTGANLNVQNQDGKTLLHYVAERNDIDGIKYFLKVIKANRDIRDKSGKTPFEYVTGHECRQALKDLGYDLDDSYENERNAIDEGYVSGNDNQTVPTKDKGNLTNDSSNYPNKHNDDQTLRDDPGHSSGDDNKIISTEPSDYDQKDEDSSCNSSNYLFLEDSLLAKLGIPLTADEQKLIDEFCEEIRGITAQNKQESEENILESIEKIVNEYLEKGLRLNSSCSNGNEKGDKETVTNLILEKIGDVLDDRVKPRDGTKAYIGRVNDINNQDDEDKDEALETIGKIIRNLLLKGGKAKEGFFYNDTELANNCGFDFANLSKECVEIKNKLISIACEGIVNKSKQTHEYDFKAEIDNVYFYVKYPQDSIIEPVKILNNEKDKKLNLKVGILQIGESIIRVESIDGKRNYTGILKGSIKMSFTTDAGEISIYLHPSEKDGNKIEVEIDKESEARLNKLKAEKRSLGENCLLGGKSVLDAIEDKVFEKNGSVPTETTKDVPSTNFTQVRLQQEKKAIVLGG